MSKKPANNDKPDHPVAPKPRGHPRGSKNKNTSTETNESASGRKNRSDTQTKVVKVGKGKGGKKSADDGGGGDQDGNGPGTVKWTPELTDALLQELTDNPEIKQGIYPGPGTMLKDENRNAMTKSNSKPKSEYQFMLAEALFSNEQHGYHTKFKTNVEEAVGWLWWGNKVKTRLEYMQHKVMTAQALMGETGVGLTSEDQIDMSLENSLTTAWGQKGLSLVLHHAHRECPNLNPIGLGNSETPIDLSILSKPSSQASSPLTIFDVDDEVDLDVDIESDGGEEEQQHVQSHGLDSNNDVDTPASEFTGKRNCSPDVKPKQGPKPGKSQKSTKPAPKKSFNPVDRSVELSRDEEATAQKCLKIKQERLDIEKELQKEKICVAGEMEIEKMKVLAELEVKKMQMAHEQEYHRSFLKGDKLELLMNSGMGFHNFSNGLQTRVLVVALIRLAYPQALLHTHLLVPVPTSKN
ncbi:hypothetical protein BT96DRAFT_996205 [Gymnopus androsaceus JB14]|uniref:Uncharacterized protein n=1 Tax=Gymnopus androsaceus JB14 TaxID=1447944 RepID=A0A6A4HIU7_9AGAR|nr:hypothetical protein BT96DRAFT_996205 [Gymnopus androsaceus JB14]